MLRSDGEGEDELEDDDVSCPESDSRSTDSERGGVELDHARMAGTGAGPSAGTIGGGAGAVVAGGALQESSSVSPVAGQLLARNAFDSCAGCATAAVE